MIAGADVKIWRSTEQCELVDETDSVCPLCLFV